MRFYVYIIQSDYDGSYYIGSTNNLTDRIERHNQGRSKYTKPKRPWRLVYCEEFASRSEAQKSELEIKNRKSRDFIESLIRTSRL